jgi:hypothetical protein
MDAKYSKILKFSLSFKEIILIFSVGLTECWASLSKDPNEKNPSFELYADKCPVAGVPWIKRLKNNGESSAVNPRGVSVIQFSFTAATASDAFYYHCKVI